MRDNHLRRALYRPLLRAQLRPLTKLCFPMRLNRNHVPEGDTFLWIAQHSRLKNLRRHFPWKLLCIRIVRSLSDHVGTELHGSDYRKQSGWNAKNLARRPRNSPAKYAE